MVIQVTQGSSSLEHPDLSSDSPPTTLKAQTAPGVPSPGTAQSVWRRGAQFLIAAALPGEEHMTRLPRSLCHPNSHSSCPVDVRW